MLVELHVFCFDICAPIIMSLNSDDCLLHRSQVVPAPDATREVHGHQTVLTFPLADGFLDALLEKKRGVGMRAHDSSYWLTVTLHPWPDIISCCALVVNRSCHCCYWMYPTQIALYSAIYSGV